MGLNIIKLIAKRGFCKIANFSFKDDITEKNKYCCTVQEYQYSEERIISISYIFREKKMIL